MIQATAAAKLTRADSTNSRPAGELVRLEVGDAVDIYIVPHCLRTFLDGMDQPQ